MHRLNRMDVSSIKQATDGGRHRITFIACASGGRAGTAQAARMSMDRHHDNDDPIAHRVEQRHHRMSVVTTA
jgi:hypothetical protein